MHLSLRGQDRQAICPLKSHSHQVQSLRQLHLRNSAALCQCCVQDAHMQQTAACLPFDDLPACRRGAMQISQPASKLHHAIFCHF